ncbi:MAG: glutamine amidotransferase-related protein, partial [Oscillospiraceae bacterium]
RVEIDWVDSEGITPRTAGELLGAADGIILPGGFGTRGVEGMIAAAQYAREHNIPYLGICLGMQIAAIEFARNVLGLADANSREFAPNTGNPVIDLMADQQGNLPKGGTMRLGAYPCQVQPNSRLMQAYNAPMVQERHRHRYEFNNAYRRQFQEAGMLLSGTSPDDRLVEALENPQQDFFVGVQYHPEFKSRPNRAHPLFREFISAAVFRQEKSR